MPLPASSLQSRIRAFESGSGLPPPLSPRIIPSTPPRVSPSPSPPNLGRKSSLLDLKIDLKDWQVLDNGSPPLRSPTFKTQPAFKKTPTQAGFDGALISFSPPKVKGPPPLPARKPSLTSLKSVGSSSSLPLSKPSPILPPPPRRGDSLTVHTYPPEKTHTQSSSVSSFHSVSLSDGTPSPSPAAAVFPQHTTGSQLSDADSFEELSASAALASPTTTALISHDWEKAMARRKQPQPPKLPARPTAAPVSPPTAPSARRSAPPPPPPDRAPSIRSIASTSSAASASTSHSTSISTSTSHSNSNSKFTNSNANNSKFTSNPHFKFASPNPTTPTTPTPASTALLTARAPPIPPSPRRRYDALFSSLYAAHGERKGVGALLAPRRRTAAGWRGLSVDLIRDPGGSTNNSNGVTNGSSASGNGNGGSPTSPDDDMQILPGPVVRVLWARSRLPLPVLSAIWSECDPGKTGALDREAFGRGMWRIDEELRRAGAASSHQSKGGQRRGAR
ncbi:hypothetical protein C8R44DRAFT_334851 [Mycena epipterygia]|nr:hypothetical protein C8R44DRAFT_334851 [Mycena epipterygia]